MKPLSTATWAPPHAATTAAGVADDDDVLAGLSAAHKRLPCRLLGEVSPELMERAHARAEHYLPRAEQELVMRHLPQIAQQVGPRARVVEVGSAADAESRALLRGLDHAVAFVPVSAMTAQLARRAAAIREAMPGVDVTPVIADLAHPFELPVPQHDWATTLVAVRGEAWGTFDPAGARALLAQLGRVAGDERLLLVAADATHDEEPLLLAYDDEATAALHEAVLAHLNRTRGATFEIDRFEHRAVWNDELCRVEHHLFSRCRQIVRVDHHTIAFTADESILTQVHYQHGPDAMRTLLAAGGWKPRQVFTAAERPVRLWLCEPLAWHSAA